MKKEKFYFREDDNVCYELDYQFDVARLNNLSEIELYEAMPDKSIKGVYWCMHNLNSVDKCDCYKLQCGYYKPRNGINGKCLYRGKLYTKGNKVKFKIK